MSVYEDIDSRVQSSPNAHEQTRPLDWEPAMHGFRASYHLTIWSAFDRIRQQTGVPLNTVAVMHSADEYLDWCLQQGRDPDRLRTAEQCRIVDAALEHLTRGWRNGSYDDLAERARIGHYDPDLTTRLRFRVNKQH